MLRQVVFSRENEKMYAVRVYVDNGRATVLSSQPANLFFCFSRGAIFGRCSICGQGSEEVVAWHGIALVYLILKVWGGKVEISKEEEYNL